MSSVDHQAKFSEPPETDLEYYARPENYRGSSLESFTRFLAAKTTTRAADPRTNKQARVDSEERKLYRRYRHILPPASSSSSSGEEEDGHVKTGLFDSPEGGIHHCSQTRRDSHTWCTHRALKQQACQQECLRTILRLPSDRTGRELLPSRSGRELFSDSGYFSRAYSDADNSMDYHQGRLTGLSTLDDRMSSLPVTCISHSSDTRLKMRGDIPKSAGGARTKSALNSARRASASIISRCRSASLPRVSLGDILAFANVGPRRQTTDMQNLHKFRRVSLAVVNVLKLAKVIIKRTDSPSALLKTFTALSRQPEEEPDQSENMKNYGLEFDPSYFRANKEISISSEVKCILRLPPGHRTPDQIQTVMFGLQSLPSFAEYPLHMQEKLAKVAWYEIVTPMRAIIRQGHFAENFYFILSGHAVVTIRKPGETSDQTAAIMRKGTSFGELALLHHSRRTATVTSQDTVQLLSVGREDFFDIFMAGHGQDQTPEHIKFISQMDFMKGWPLERLLERPDQCLLHFFKRNTLIVKDSEFSDWFYVVKSGSCQVLKQLKSVTASIGQSKTKPGQKSNSRFGDHWNYNLINDDRKGADNWRRKRTPKLRQGEVESHARPAGLGQWDGTHEQGPQSPVFVQIELLKSKDVFGLNLVNLSNNMDSKPPSVSLVSLGAECIMLSKAFFMKHATDSIKKRFPEITQPYPDQDMLQTSLQTKVDWELYKKSLISSILGRKRTLGSNMALRTKV